MEKWRVTPEVRIAQLEAELARERARADGLQEIVHALTVKNRSSNAERQARFRARHGVTGSVTVTPPGPPSSPPFPSPFPPSPDPSSPYPLSFPPSSPSPSLSPSAVASAAGGQGELLPEVPPTPPAKPAKKAKEARKPEAATDPRHAPLVASLAAEGWPFDGGKDAANVKALLALADQQEATRGELAGMEVLRRARIAWSQFPDFHSARTLTQLRLKWGEFAAPLDGGGGQDSGSAPIVPIRRLVEM